MRFCRPAATKRKRRLIMEEAHKALARTIEHTQLSPTATRADILRACAEAITIGCAGVCVNPCWIHLVAEQLMGTALVPICVVGFPLGATMPVVKADETRMVVEAGAKEIDMVMNLGWLKSGSNRAVQSDIAGVVVAAQGRPVKVIIETSLLTHQEKLVACHLAREAGAVYVKTSTGFVTGGATVEDVLLLRQTVGNAMRIKASGGIRDLAQAQALLAAGADRLGCSRSVAILEEAGWRP